MICGVNFRPIAFITLKLHCVKLKNLDVCEWRVFTEPFTYSILLKTESLLVCHASSETVEKKTGLPCNFGMNSYKQTRIAFCKNIYSSVLVLSIVEVYDETSICSKP